VRVEAQPEGEFSYRGAVAAYRSGYPEVRCDQSRARIALFWREHDGSSTARVADHIGYVCASSARGGSRASWAQRIAGGVTALLLPAAVPTGSGPSSEGPFDLFWRG
jgi:hypothetical protein